MYNKKAYTKALLYVSEIFHSIQGEGPNAGYPVVFLRTAGCNLRCTWCDTPYALEFRQGKKMEAHEVISDITSFNCKHLVITGGEPMIQQKGLKEVLQQLNSYFVEIETNGSFASEIEEFVNQYNCSPKLKNSGNKAYELKLLPNDKTWYKFVVDTEEAFQEVLQYIDRYQLPHRRVRIMPEGRTAKETQKKSPWLIKLCKTHGFIFNPRLHLLFNVR